MPKSEGGEKKVAAGTCWKIRSCDDFVRWLYAPVDPSSLGLIRIMFGILMMADLPEERAGSQIDQRWGEPRDCHFPLFDFLKPPPLPYIGLLYGIMWLGALGIALGFKFRSSVAMFGVPYWYLLLLDKSFWNNHSYLFGVVTILLAGTSANNYCSIDGLLDKKKRDAHVPRWNYLVLKFQFFMLYFLAGLKKTDFEWLEGYSMTNLGKHWVFNPFQIALSETVWHFGSLVGTISSSYLFAVVDYIGVFSTCTALVFLALLYTAFLIPETIENTEKEGRLKELLSLSNIKDSIVATFKKRENRARTIILVCSLLMFVGTFCFAGEMQIKHLYLRQHFGWSLRKLTHYASVNMIVHTVGALLGIYVFNKLFKMHETAVMFIGLFPLVISSLLRALGTEDLHIYIAAAVGCFGGVTGPMIRSLISKLVLKDEVGKIFSLNGTLDLVGRLIASSVYTMVYNETINTAPGAYNYITASLLLLGAMLTQIVLTTEQIDYLVVHWFGFLLDLTIGFWMLYHRTRPLAMLFCASFHLMNSRLFTIGMFPYVCLATMPLFCEENWPRRLRSALLGSRAVEIKRSANCVYSKDGGVTWKHRLVAGLLLTHCGLQAFLPYSHFITKGYNNWTKGLYGYSWDMMVHAWDTVLVVVKVVDNDSGEEYFLDPDAWTQNDRWSKHADMCLQYAHCLKRNLNEGPTDQRIASQNLSVYIDVWCSLNGRFQQRMYDPNYDLLRADWSPFRPVPWLLPLLSEYNDRRAMLEEIQAHVYSWSNHSDVLFVADFPGLHLENYISSELDNVTLGVLEGEVFYEMEDEAAEQSLAVKLRKGDGLAVETGLFHRVHTVGPGPSCYMYTYVNRTREGADGGGEPRRVFGGYSPFPLVEDVGNRVGNFAKMASHVYAAFGEVLSGMAATKGA